jgi:hypothetical protein
VDSLHRRHAGNVTFRRTGAGRGEVRFETDDICRYVTDVETTTGGVSRFGVR